MRPKADLGLELQALAPLFEKNGDLSFEKNSLFEKNGDLSFEVFDYIMLAMFEIFIFFSTLTTKRL